MKSSKDHPEVPTHLKHIWQVVDYGDNIPQGVPVALYWDLLQRFLDNEVKAAELNKL